LRDYEEDHLIAIGLGGSPTAPQNLWPEPHHVIGGWGSYAKDSLEDTLHQLVCQGRVPLTQAQRDIASDWIAAYKRYVGPNLSPAGVTDGSTEAPPPASSERTQMNTGISSLPNTRGLRPAFLTGAIIIIALIIIGGVFVQIGPGQRGVLMTFGAVHDGVLDPGLHLKLPFAQSVVRMDVQVQNSQAQETAASLDLQNVSSTVATNWHILPADAEWVYQHIGSESDLVDKIIRPAISNSVKAVTAHYNAEDLIIRRDAVRDEIQKQITSELQPYRIVVDSVNITDFHFSEEFAQAIERKQIAQQRALQARYELDQAKVLAQQRVVEAQAQSQAQQLLQQTLTPEIIQQQAIAKWDGRLPAVVGDKSVLPMIGNIATNATAARK
jgi:regulator of protease activity HflC (stomatin/prohibitin superfamily)